MNLPEEKITAGRLLLEKLDESNRKVAVALWLCLPDTSSWKFGLYFPDIEKDGSRLAYSIVQKALGQLQGSVLKLEEVILFKRNTPYLNDLGSFIQTGEGISGLVFSGNVINGRILPDSYIYRVNLRHSSRS